MDRLSWVLIICGIIGFAIATVPDDRIRVSPTLMFELGNAYNQAGDVPRAKACYQLVLEFEDRFGFRGSYLPKYQQMARANLRNLEINTTFKASPLLRQPG